MALRHASMVKETSTTTGTGTYTLAGAASGFRTFVAGIGDANQCYYMAKMGTDWEEGIGTVDDQASDTLTRDVILASSTGSAINWGAGTKEIVCHLPGSKFLVGSKGYIYGLTMSNAAGDTTNDIQVEAGECMDDTGEEIMTLSSAIVKQIDAIWAVGTAAGGMNTGAVANATWYEVLLIKRRDTGVVDVMFSTTANRATLPTNYTHKRRIGWVRRGTATNLQFTQVGCYFTLTTQINDVAAAPTATAAAVTLTVPPNCTARFRASATSSASVNTAQVTCFSEIVEGNVTPDDATGIASIGYMDIVGAAAGHYELRVNSSSQIEHDSDAAVSTFDISTFGWIDDRGREASA